MGWTHDYSDAARNRRSAPGSSELNPFQGGGPQGQGHRSHQVAIGIPRILRRRARWVSARLRHTTRA
ncbi:hypothetical protein [Streptomyces sp. N35]|uniref:hypothetical protein n=1 Tax=Streptomyces sp. N35 TaxID=2795730 RepID=UPI001F211CB5|nr:hypothetical protein [Streptomyces sp. N35]